MEWINLAGAVGWFGLAIIWMVTKERPSMTFTVMMALILCFSCITDMIVNLEEKYEQTEEK